MAHVHKEFLVDATPDDVWAAVRDVGEVHRRLARGFVTDTRLEADTRVVTFANGVVVHELLVDIDDEARRVAYAVVGGALAPKHHHASMQVFTDGKERSRFVWITDVTPDDLAGPITEMVDQGARVIKQTLEMPATSDH
ncbi:SRPBCC family protein [Streptomyces sp. V1I6]|uniref:SRPBCC family protein n=1 Tax=Streptomyces sp. V1I6 TaxID=3042273 RepID=UPI00277FF83F|nr:SRPBCC family protein [Streptomyces sp. V1I6]MDQ0847231.1 carbon monoxide dehydrogenase subunit G [Streptomyces sp. V1I6]